MKKIAIVTGGAGLLGNRFCKAINEMGWLAIAIDINFKSLDKNILFYDCDITEEIEVMECLECIKKDFPDHTISGLVNCAALDPKIDKRRKLHDLLSTYNIEHFEKEVKVALTGSLICTKIFGSEMCKNQEGSIINISSLLGVVAPNQNFYRSLQASKPVGYTVVKHGIIGLTRHTATEWAQHNVRCNALAPNGVYNNHPEEFVEALTKYIPLGRMADKDEYNEAIRFLLTDASRYMTGHTLVIDGGASIW